MKKSIKRVITIILSAILCISCAACSIGKDKGEIHGMSREEYVNQIASIVEAIYIPQSAEDFSNMRSVFSEYAKESVVNEFSKVAPDYRNETYSSTIKWITKAYGPGEYQYEGLRRVYYEFEVIRNYKHYKVCLVFVIDDDDTIANYKVF